MNTTNPVNLADPDETVVFYTPTVLDPRAFTTFGVNAKPNTKSPIGYFGTGLKYAIAVLTRFKIPIRIVIRTKEGEETWSFYAKPTEYRDKAFNIVKARRKLPNNRTGHKELPFTTELGKTWPLWQALRELEANTRDEGGTSSAASAFPIDDLAEEYTIIEVPSKDFMTEFLNIDKVFLPKGARSHIEVDGDNLQIFSEPSKHLYYRGMRVYDLPEDRPAAFTYNLIGEQELTEDRTLKHPFMYAYYVGAYIVGCRDRDLIRRIVTTPSDKFWEGRIDWDSYTTPSAEFMDVMEELQDDQDIKVLPGASTTFLRYKPAPPPKSTDDGAKKLPLAELIRKLKDAVGPTSTIIVPEEVEDLIKQAIPHLESIEGSDKIATTDQEMPF